MRLEMQMIFQDPYESLDPRMDVFSILAEPLEVNRIAARYRERRERVNKVLEDVRLVPIQEFIRRFPHELSGGQRRLRLPGRTRQPVVRHIYGRGKRSLS